MSIDIIEALYRDVNGNALSHKWRDRNLPQDEKSTFAYGETSYETMKSILSHELVRNRVLQGASFLDIGSGVGNVVISTAMIADFAKISGVEMMDETFNKSVEIKTEFEKIKPDLANKIHLMHKNALDLDLSEYDVIYANHPISKSSPIRQQLLDKFKYCKKNTLFIGVISGIDRPEWTLMYSKIMQFSWGDGTVKYYVKTA